jgi:hypothetical protein
MSLTLGIVLKRSKHRAAMDATADERAQPRGDLI